MNKRPSVLPIVIGGELPLRRLRQVDLAKYRAEALARELGRAWVTISLRDQRDTKLPARVKRPRKSPSK
jgi:hypothetical protein